MNEGIKYVFDSYTCMVKWDALWLGLFVLEVLMYEPYYIECQ